jgi:hypothetical protein
MVIMRSMEKIDPFLSQGSYLGPTEDLIEQYLHLASDSWTFYYLDCPHPTARVSTEFRRHGIPSVFFTSVYSVFRAELAAIPAEFRRIL